MAPFTSWLPPGASHPSQVFFSMSSSNLRAVTTVLSKGHRLRMGTGGHLSRNLWYFIMHDEKSQHGLFMQSAHNMLLHRCLQLSHSWRKQGGELQVGLLWPKENRTPN